MIYTKTGDGGTTSLVGGRRVDKDDPRVESYGTVDELGAHIGLLGEMVRSNNAEIHAYLKVVQHKLFDIQTLLATEEEDIAARLPQITPDDVADLEQHIDALTATVPQLHNFVVAGGTMAGAQAHVCRTVCRRAERRVVTLSHTTDINANLRRYLNRLSDYLFVLSRHLVTAAGKKEDLYIS